MRLKMSALTWRLGDNEVEDSGENRIFAERFQRILPGDGTTEDHFARAGNHISMNVREWEPFARHLGDHKLEIC